MRLKKLMSLVLACAMALSLVTVASAADTEVYFIENFDSYADAAAYVDSVNSISVNANKNFTAALGMPKKDGAANNVAYWTTGSGYLQATQRSGWDMATIQKNSLGNNSLRFWSKGYATTVGRNEGGTIISMPEQAWDMDANLGETLVISYEITTDPGFITSTQTSYFEGFTLWGGNRTTAGDGTVSWDTTPQQMQFFTMVTPAATAETTEVTEAVAEGDVDGTVTTLNAAGQKVVTKTVISGDTKTVTTTTTTPATYSELKPTNANQNSWGTAKTLVPGQAYRVAIGFKADAANIKTGTNGTYYFPTRLFAFEGEEWVNVTKEYTNFSFEGRDKFYGILQSPGTSFGSEYANYKMYTIKSDDFKVYTENTTDLPLNTKSVRVYFSNIVSPATYAAPVVKKNGVAMEEGTYAVSAIKDYVGNVGGEIYSYVDVSFESLEEATTYTVEFPETITNEIGTALTGKNVATFSTKLPDVKLGSLAVVGAANLIADGSLQKATVTLENTTAANKAVALIYAVYGANGQLADVVYVNDEIVANETADIDVELKYAAAGTAKAFVWNNMEALKPYTGTKTLTIAAPAAAE